MAEQVTPEMAEAFEKQGIDDPVAWLIAQFKRIATDEKTSTRMQFNALIEMKDLAVGKRVYPTSGAPRRRVANSAPGKKTKKDEPDKKGEAKRQTYMEALAAQGAQSAQGAGPQPEENADVAQEKRAEPEPASADQPG